MRQPWAIFTAVLVPATAAAVYAGTAALVSKSGASSHCVLSLVATDVLPRQQGVLRTSRDRLLRRAGAPGRVGAPRSPQSAHSQPH